MKRFLLLFWFVFLSFYGTRAQKFHPPAVPDSIRQTADAVILHDNTEIRMQNTQSMTVDVSRQIIIYNRRAAYLADVVVGYNMFTKIKKLQVRYYNAAGKQLKMVLKSQFRDVAASGDAMLYSDYRALVYDDTPPVYPYIVSVHYTIETQNTAFIPEWMPVSAYHIGLLHSRYAFYYPPGLKVHRIERNLEKFHVHKGKPKNPIIYTLDHVPPLIREPLAPPLDKSVPYVRLAVNKFYLAGVSGKADSWQELGQWMYKRLLRGKDHLNPKTVQEIKSLVAGIQDPVQKAEKIYEYVQNKTRYVDVAIGIGGWMPVPAEEVDRLGYGDCKALTNYTKALLDVAGVPSYYTVVYAGDEKTDIEPQMVGIQGNHAFLCIPNGNDTLWLECTNQKLPFGYTGSFTDDRNVFMVTPQGGKIIRTPALTPEQNFQKTIAEYHLDAGGNLTGKISVAAYGTQYGRLLFRYDGLDETDLRKSLRKEYAHLQNLHWDKIRMTNDKKNKAYKEELVLKAGNYAIPQSDGSLLFTVNAFNRITYVPPRVIDRKTPFVIERGYKDEDIYTIHLPDGYKADGLPNEINYDSEFGTYTMSLKQKDANTLIYHRIFMLKSGTYPPEKYRDYRKFRKKIKKWELKKIIILK